MFRRIHIINIKAADFIFKEAYLAITLLNLRGTMFKTFYKMDLLLEHQIGKFKRF